MGLQGQIESLQNAQKHWMLHNFPSAESWEALAGMTEELGELAHAHLKGFNAIRAMRDPEAVQAAKADAVGDIFIYLMSYCNTNNLDLETCIDRAWSEVKERDWVANPVDGRV